MYRREYIVLGLFCLLAIWLEDKLDAMVARATNIRVRFCLAHFSVSLKGEPGLFRGCYLTIFHM